MVLFGARPTKKIKFSFFFVFKYAEQQKRFMTEYKLVLHAVTPRTQKVMKGTVDTVSRTQTDPPRVGGPS